MRKGSSGWRVLWFGFMTLFFAAHLFDIPGLIARHHQGGWGLGPWFTWSIAVMEVIFSAYGTVILARNWLVQRSAAVR
jgi:hypothetical protein